MPDMPEQVASPAAPGADSPEAVEGRGDLHLPEDAGEWAEGLTRVLERIPPEWGPWVSCGKGWYPIVVRLDEGLAQVVPGYALHQVKEKLGGLRYYVDLRLEPPFPEPACSTGATSEALSAFRRRHDEWRRQVQTWKELTPEGRERDRLEDACDAFIRLAMAEAARTCELCGAPGTMHKSGLGRLQTLCAQDAARGGFKPVGAPH